VPIEVNTEELAEDVEQDGLVIGDGAVEVEYDGRLITASPCVDDIADGHRNSLDL
jgi:hypothetical protein